MVIKIPNEEINIGEQVGVQVTRAANWTDVVVFYGLIAIFLIVLFFILRRRKIKGGKLDEQKNISSDISDVRNSGSLLSDEKSSK
jgi:hypothetical protein